MSYAIKRATEAGKKAGRAAFYQDTGTASSFIMQRQKLAKMYPELPIREAFDKAYKKEFNSHDINMRPIN